MQEALILGAFFFFDFFEENGIYLEISFILFNINSIDEFY